jgi:hypothetical protein
MQCGIERAEGEEPGAAEGGEPALPARSQQERVKYGGGREAEAKALP